MICAAAMPHPWAMTKWLLQTRIICAGYGILLTHAGAGKSLPSGPEFGQVMPPYKSLSEKDTVPHLRRAAFKGARFRYKNLSEEVKTRLEHALKIISSIDFFSRVCPG